MMQLLKDEETAQGANPVFSKDRLYVDVDVPTA
jgi:hypothetical protein